MLRRGEMSMGSVAVAWTALIVATLLCVAAYNWGIGNLRKHYAKYGLAGWFAAPVVEPNEPDPEPEPSVSGDISGWVLPNSLPTFYVNLTSVDYGTGGMAATWPSGLTKIYVDNCGWDYLTVNRFLADCVLSGKSSKELDIAAPVVEPNEPDPEPEPFAALRPTRDAAGCADEGD
jgi:hypothetical protein